MGDAIDNTRSDIDVANKFARVLGACDIIMDGTNEALIMSQKIDELQGILENNEKCMEILDGIIDCSGLDSNLGKAALQLKSDLERENEEATSKFLECAKEFTEGALESFAMKASEEAIENFAEYVAGESLLPLKIIEIGGKTLHTIFNWDDAYASAEQLMTLTVMDAEMNVLGANENSEGYQYYAQLWALLQTKGDEYAGQLLYDWNKGNALDMKDFGINDGIESVSAKAFLEDEHLRYSTLLKELGWNGEINEYDFWKRHTVETDYAGDRID